MSDRIFIIPKEGLLVRHPEKKSSHIPSEGGWVNYSTYVKRLVMSGDVTVDKTKVEAESKAKAVKKDGGKDK